MLNSKIWHNGEKIASEYLKKNGYKILLTNDKLAGVEIDIVALLPKKEILSDLKKQFADNKLQKFAFDAVTKQIEDTIVFVEVKARSSIEFGLPQEAVTIQKQSHIKRYANAFLKKYNYYKSVRFDVISVLFDDNKNKIEIEHIKDAF